MVILQGMTHIVTIDLSSLPTEAINEATRNLSRISTREALQLINNEDRKVAEAVSRVLDAVAVAVDCIAERLSEGGRLFYIGAGTSGRLGVVDASECPPTFGTPPELVQGIIAGGREAMFRSQEGAEDSPEDGAQALRDNELSSLDTVVGLAASGRTPYVIGALQYAQSIKAFTAGITVNPQAAMKPHCDVFIAPVVGPEAIAGSTRMKAGTAQKLVLNMISTGVMLRMGRVEGNLMADVQPMCEKLVDRAQRLVMNMANVDVQTAQRVLEECNGNVRGAVAKLRAQ
jgi:N-acetylmuramic acid 6-phosphate etherase